LNQGALGARSMVSPQTLTSDGRWVFDESETTIFEVERSIKMCLSSASSIEALEPSSGGRRAGYSASQRTVAPHNNR